MGNEFEERRRLAIARATRSVARALSELVEAASLPRHDPHAFLTETPPGDPLDALTMDQIAEITGLAKQTLRNMRVRGDGPPTWLLRGRVRCYRQDLQSWMERTRRS